MPPDEKDVPPERVKWIPRSRDADKPPALPGIHRYASFTNLTDRMTTPALNRAVMVGVGAAVALDVLRPIALGMWDAAYCYECRACYATQEKCPASITFQAELTVACRTMDYRRFINNRGLLCFRCGNCTGFCVQHLDLAGIYGKMGTATVRALRAGKIPFDVVEEALSEGRIGREYVDAFYEWYREHGGRKLG
ncbi:MAG: hypothetical protein JSU81_00685 [Candidatus Coatesbacteria bacterium]|nr:MAG: hypothetical protein JSU81_00685 [Candidatus Coatesbacteria bacterium]